MEIIKHIKIMNILIIGVNGQLGSEIKYLSNNYNYSFFFTNKNELDITNKMEVKHFIQKNKINIIINCSAYTAVDKAETEEELVDLINHQAVRFLGELAKEKMIKIIHISTDYVFDGNLNKPYSENDITNPQNIYGKTKLAGEIALTTIAPDESIIIRTSWLYSSFGSNFVNTMIKLGNNQDSINVIKDQFGNPTYARDLASTILNLIPKLNHSGVELYHYSNEGICSWYDFAKTIMEISNINCKVIPQLTENYPTLAKRPKFSPLNKYKIKNKFNIEIPHWKDSLKNYLKSII